MTDNKQGEEPKSTGPRDGAGCENEAELMALQELEKAENHAVRAGEEMEEALKDERGAEREIEKAKRDLSETRKHHVVHFFVDGEEYEAKQHEWTPNAIIQDFGEQDPATNYLVRLGGHEPHSYRDKGTIPIKIHDCERFQIIPLGPAPVSDGTKLTGIAAFIAGLKELGYEPVALEGNPEHLVINYTVQTGKFAGQTVRLGFVVPGDFPLTVPGGVSVSPRFHPNSNGKTHPTGGISDSSVFQSKASGQWHHWSRSFNEWGKTKKTVAVFMNHVFRLWDSQ